MAKKKIPPEKYWQNRFEILTAKQFTASEEYMKELEHQYWKANVAIEKDIHNWYAKFAVNNEISMQQARKLLSGNDLAEFKWSVQEYIDKGKNIDVDPTWIKQLENASAKMHVSRLEAIQLQMQNHIETLYGGQEKGFKSILSEIYADQYYHTGFEIQKGIGVGSTFAKLDPKKVEKVITTPWTNDDQTFSKRIWSNRTKLLGDVRNALSQSIIRGENPSIFNEKLAKMFKTSQSNAGRLLMTESAFFASAAEKDAYKTLGIERYQIVATLDQKTSDICIDMDGKDFALSEYDIGITAPPFHPWCRTTTVPYFNDEFTVNEYRAARSATNGEVYYIPADIKYNDWMKIFVANPGAWMEDFEAKFVDEILYIEHKPKVELPKLEDLSEEELKALIAKMKDEAGDLGDQIDKYLTQDHPELDYIPITVYEDQNLKQVFLDFEDYQQTNEEMNAIIKKFLNGEISEKEYMEQGQAVHQILFPKSEKLKGYFSDGIDFNNGKLMVTTKDGFTYKLTLEDVKKYQEIFPTYDKMLDAFSKIDEAENLLNTKFPPPVPPPKPSPVESLEGLTSEELSAKLAKIESKLNDIELDVEDFYGNTGFNKIPEEVFSEKSFFSDLADMQKAGEAWYDNSSNNALWDKYKKLLKPFQEKDYIQEVDLVDITFTNGSHFYTEYDFSIYDELEKLYSQKAELELQKKEIEKLLPPKTSPILEPKIDIPKYEVPPIEGKITEKKITEKIESIESEIFKTKAQLTSNFPDELLEVYDEKLFQKYLDYTEAFEKYFWAEGKEEQMFWEKSQNIKNELKGMGAKYVGKDALELDGKIVQKTDAEKALKFYTYKADEVAKMKVLKEEQAKYQALLEEKQAKKAKKEILKKTKELKAQKAIADEAVANYANKDFVLSGVWKEDVKVSDYPNLNIKGKEDYYTQKVYLSSGIPEDKMQEYQAHLKDLMEFKKYGEEYKALLDEQQKINSELTSLKNGNKINKGIASGAYTQERKDNAMWAKRVADADTKMREKCGEVWRKASREEREAMYDYTRTYNRINEPLRGIEYGTSHFVGVGKLNLDDIGTKYHGYEKGFVRKLINRMTDIIDRSTYDFDMWVQRGIGYDGADKFFGISMSDIKNADEKTLQSLLLGKNVTEYAFCSCGVAKGKGFDHQPIILNIYAPSGTKMLYAEPFSHYGMGAQSPSWDGISAQSYFGDEAETILQQGTVFKITKVERNNGKIWVDVDVVAQNEVQR